MIKSNFNLLSTTVKENILRLTLKDFECLNSIEILSFVDLSGKKSISINIPKRYHYFAFNFISGGIGIIFSFNKPKDTVLSELADNRIMVIYGFPINEFIDEFFIRNNIIEYPYRLFKEVLNNYRKEEINKSDGNIQNDNKIKNNNIEKLPLPYDKPLDIYQDSIPFLDVTNSSEYKLLKIETTSLFYYDEFRGRILISINKKFTDEERIDLLFNHATCIYNNKIIIGDGQRALSLLEYALNNYGSNKLYEYFDKSEAIKEDSQELIIPEEILSDEIITMLNTLVSKKHFSEYNVITDLNNIGLKSYNCIDKSKLEEWERIVYTNIYLAEKQLSEYIGVVKSNYSTLIKELEKKVTGEYNDNHQEESKNKEDDNTFLGYNLGDFKDANN